MIYAAINTLCEKLSGHLNMVLPLNDDIVVLRPLENIGDSAAPNKICLSLVGVERETAGGIRFGSHGSSDGNFRKTTPDWQLNLYIMVSAVFSDKQYGEGLQLLSLAVQFIQNNNTLAVNGESAPLALEPVNLSFSEMSNLWSVCGGTYYPSMLCKLRVLSVNSNEIRGISRPISEKEISIGKKPEKYNPY